MRILAVESSTIRSSVALVEDDRLYQEVFLDHPPTTHLIDTIDSVLGAAHFKIHDVDLFAIGKGPGTFTGLRVGMSTVLGLALVDQQPIVAVPSLEVMAYEFAIDDSPITCVTHAHHDQVFCGIYRRDPDGDIICIQPPELIPIFNLKSGQRIGFPRASSLAFLAHLRYSKNGIETPRAELEPDYIVTPKYKHEKTTSSTHHLPST